MSSELPSLVDHLDLYFGRIEHGCRPTEWIDLAIQIAEFRGGKIPGVTVVSTLGLSSFLLQSPVSAKKIRQELFVMAKEGQVDTRLPAILDQVERERARTDTAVLRGDVIAKHGSFLDSGDFGALYATLPAYYPDSFWSFHHEDDVDVVLAGLLPINRKEQLYVSQNGWSAFEELLDNAKFHLFDLERPSLL